MTERCGLFGKILKAHRSVIVSNRDSAFSDTTTKRFIACPELVEGGQYHEKDLPGGEGLSSYNARWYDAQS